jgi:hypothetical protein
MHLPAGAAVGFPLRRGAGCECRPGRRWVTAIAAAVVCLLALPTAAVAGAPDMAARMQEAHLTPGIMFSLLFLMIGSIKILAPFVSLTHGSDPAFRF